MPRKRPTGFRKVGTIYGEFRGRPLYHYRCRLLPGSALDGQLDGCCHFTCRLQALRDAGYDDVADKLSRNATAQDWRRNWGKMVYDEQEHGRDPRRRQLAADYMRQLRNDKMSITAATISGCHIGALLPKS